MRAAQFTLHFMQNVFFTLSFTLKDYSFLYTQDLSGVPLKFSAISIQSSRFGAITYIGYRLIRKFRLEIVKNGRFVQFYCTCRQDL